jgi:hypothetical protein
MYQILGAMPADEDPVLEMNDIGYPTLFDFFRLGKPGQGPFHQSQLDLNEDGANARDWDEWMPTGDVDVDPTPLGLNVGQLEVEPEDDNNEEAMPDLNLPKNAELIQQQQEENTDQEVPFGDLNSLENVGVNQQQQHHENMGLEVPFGDALLEINDLNAAISKVIDSFEQAGGNSGGEVTWGLIITKMWMSYWHCQLHQ